MTLTLTLVTFLLKNLQGCLETCNRTAFSMVFFLYLGDLDLVLCDLDLNLVWPWPLYLPIKLIFYLFLFTIHQKAKYKFAVCRFKLTFETPCAIDMSTGPFCSYPMNLCGEVYWLNNSMAMVFIHHLHDDKRSSKMYNVYVEQFSSSWFLQYTIELQWLERLRVNRSVRSGGKWE